MKRVLSLFTVIIAGISLLLSGCTGEVDRNAELRESLKATQTSLNDTFNEESCDFSLVSEYLRAWAESSDIDILMSEENYVILENPATEGASGDESTTFQCSINTTDCEKSLETMATALTCLLGPETHGDLRLIVTEYTDGQRIGARSVPASFLKCDNFINMQYSKTTSVYTSGPEAVTCTMETPSSPEEPAYEEAYRITMSIDKYTDPFSFDKSNNYPNPINVIGSMLAGAQSAGKLFEVASFSSSSIDSYGPYKATATVVINSSHVDSFMSRFEKSYENIDDKFKDIDAGFIYTMTPVSMPEKVLGEDATNNLISLMYTLNTGICYQDEDSGLIQAASYISSISTDKKIDIKVNVRARNSESLENLIKEYEITSGLCDISYSCGKPSPVWASSPDSDLASWFSDRVPVESDDSVVTIKQYDNDYFHMKNPDLNMISYTFDSSDAKRVLVNVTDFLSREEQ